MEVRLSGAEARLPDDLSMRLNVYFAAVRGEMLDEYLDGINLSLEERNAVIDAINLRCAWSAAKGDVLRQRTDEKDTVCMLINLTYLTRPIRSGQNLYGDGTSENPYPVRCADEAVDWLRRAWPDCPTMELGTNQDSGRVHKFLVDLGGRMLPLSFRYVV